MTALNDMQLLEPVFEQVDAHWAEQARAEREEAHVYLRELDQKGRFYAARHRYLTGRLFRAETRDMIYRAWEQDHGLTPTLVPPSAGSHTFPIAWRLGVDEWVTNADLLAWWQEHYDKGARALRPVDHLPEHKLRWYGVAMEQGKVDGRAAYRLVRLPEGATE